MTEDIERLRFNTAIAALMEFLNALEPYALRLTPEAWRHAYETLVLLLAPLAPHIAEELWSRLGHANSLAHEPWPSYDPAALEQTHTVWIVQVNGKVRAKLTLPAGASEEQLKQAVLSDAQVARYVDGQAIKQMIVVPKRLINLVV